VNSIGVKGEIGNSAKKAGMKRLVFAPVAARDLEEIWEYVAEDCLDAADRLLDRIPDLLT